jgi:hypothetical protein
MVSDPEAIHFDGLSPFRTCGHDLAEFSKGTVWASLDQYPDLPIPVVSAIA